MTPAPLSALGLAFMLVSVSAVTLLVTWCYAKVLSLHG